MRPRRYFCELVRARISLLTPLLLYRIRGIQPFYSLLLRSGWLGDRLLVFDYRTSERIVEEPWLFRFLNRHRRVRDILDIGCSGSYTPLMLASLGYRVAGVDRGDYPLTHPNFQFMKADICKMPFRPASFDFVVCLSTLEHIGMPAYGLPEFDAGDRLGMQQIEYCLKPQGLLYLSVPFGRRAVTWQRIYDWEQLETLLSGFSVLESVFYRRHDGKFWQPEARRVLGQMDTASPEGVTGVAILLCQKK